MSKEFEDQKFEAFMAWVEGDDSLADGIDFDMYARDPNDWAWLQQFIPGIVISSAGGVCPFQAEGMIHGLPFYYRERHGEASLNVATADGNAVYGDTILYTSYEEVDEFRDGPGWISSLMNLVENLKKSPFMYLFPCKSIKFFDGQGPESFYATDEMDEKVGWGHSPEEAWAASNTFSDYLVEKGWSRDIQNRMWEAREVSKTPLNSDDREYPDPEPVFEVRVPELWRDESGRIEIPAEFFCN